MIKHVYFFPNGMTAVTDENGQQVAALQGSWLLTWVRWAAQNSYDLMGAKLHLPDGIEVVEVYKNERGVTTFGGCSVESSFRCTSKSLKELNQYGLEEGDL